MAACELREGAQRLAEPQGQLGRQPTRSRSGPTQAPLLATTARGLVAQLPLRLGQPLGAFPELAGGLGGGGAAPCSSRPVSG